MRKDIVGEISEIKTKPVFQQTDAALKIQKFWRANGFFTHFLSLQAASCLEIQQGRCHAIFHRMMNYCIMEVNQFVLYVLPETETDPPPPIKIPENKTMLLTSDPDDRSKVKIWLQKNNTVGSQAQVVINLADAKILGLTPEDLMTFVSAKTLQRVSRQEHSVLLDKIMALCGYDRHIKQNLKMVAHALYTKGKAGDYSSDTRPFKNLLRYLFADKKSLVADIVRVLNDSYSGVCSIIETKSQPQSETKPKKFDLAERKQELAATDKESYWGEKRGVNKTDIVTIVHWGGLQCLRGVIYRHQPGYLLENEMGLGLQVIPIKEEIALEEVKKYRAFSKYATLFAYKSYYNFDIHARLFAQVEAQYVLPAENGHEAGFPTVYVGHLKNVAIDLLYSVDQEFEYLCQYPDDPRDLLSRYSDSTLLYQRYKHTIDKVSSATLKHTVQTGICPLRG